MIGSIGYEAEQIGIRIFGHSEDESSVSVDILTGILQGMQKAVYAIAEDEEQCHQKIPKDFKQRYVIRCKVPKAGSYALPVEFGNSDRCLIESPLREAIKNVGSKLNACFRDLSEGTLDGFRSLKSPLLQKQILNAFRSIIPKSDAKWQLGISVNHTGQEFRYTRKTGKILKQFREDLLPLDRASLQTVTGHLVAMEFDERRIVLKYPPTGTELDCYYNDELEAALFENRRELLQISGNVTYSDDRETPKKIADVDSIQFLDLSDFVLDSFAIEDQEIRFTAPVVLSPILTESCQFMMLEDTALGIDVIAQTREELLEELAGELRMLWEQSQMPDNELGEKFQKQKRKLLAIIQEKKHVDTKTFRS